MAKLLFSKGSTAQEMSRRHRRGELHRVRRGIYVDSDDPEAVTEVLESKWHLIACYLFPDPVAVVRTAAELKPAAGRIYCVSNQLSGRRTVNVGHLRFDIGPGNTEQGVELFAPEMKRSNRSRYLLENLQTSKGNPESRRTLGRDWVESELVKLVQRHGEGGLNSLRDEARELSSILEVEGEFDRLESMISAILRTHSSTGVLQTRLGIAQAQGASFDEIRLQRFRLFGDYLENITFTEHPYTYSSSGWRNLSFYESYFSNYIEGTEFTVEEAEEIVFKGEAIPNRHQDSHDVVSHMEICSDVTEMHRTPRSAPDLIDILKLRHGILMAERPDKNPGEFKERPNRAGGSDFVLPELVVGTLVHGFSVYESLPGTIEKAMFMHFLISECHPFEDGNGRISRIMMNAELVSGGQFKIIVPTVHRESYLGGLRAASRQNRFRTMIKVLHQLQSYTSSLTWDDYGEAKSELQSHAADQEPERGVGIFNRIISSMGDSYPAG